MEPVQANKGNHKDESCSHQNNVPIPNLIENNSTTQTYEVLICCLFLFTVLSSIYVANILYLVDDVCISYWLLPFVLFICFILFKFFQLLCNRKVLICDHLFIYFFIITLQWKNIFSLFYRGAFQCLILLFPFRFG